MIAELISQGTYVKVDKEMVFPNPSSEKLSDIEWRFRHARESVTDSDLLIAASVMGAYKEMVLHKTQTERNKVCGSIKSVTNR